MLVNASDFLDLDVGAPGGVRLLSLFVLTGVVSSFCVTMLVVLPISGC